MGHSLVSINELILMPSLGGGQRDYPNFLIEAAELAMGTWHLTQPGVEACSASTPQIAPRIKAAPEGHGRVLPGMTLLF